VSGSGAQMTANVGGAEPSLFKIAFAMIERAEFSGAPPMFSIAARRLPVP
jgi:hypothetical protein